MAAIIKQFAYEGDQTFWNPMGLGFMIFLVVLALLWAVWFALDAVHSALTMYRTRLTGIDQALRRDDWVAAALQERIYSAQKQAANGKASSPMEPAGTCARLQQLIRHLQSECRVRLARANTGGLLGAMAGLIITGSDTAQKLMQIKVPIEVPPTLWHWPSESCLAQSSKPTSPPDSHDWRNCWNGSYWAFSRIHRPARAKADSP